MKFKDFEKNLLENDYFDKASLEELTREHSNFSQHAIEVKMFRYFLYTHPIGEEYGSVLTDEAHSSLKDLIYNLNTLVSLYEKYLKKLKDRIDERFFEIKELTK